MTKDEKLEKLKMALVYIYQMMKTKLPNDVHQSYINEVLEDIGEEKQE